MKEVSKPVTAQVENRGARRVAYRGRGKSPVGRRPLESSTRTRFGNAQVMGDILPARVVRESA